MTIYEFYIEYILTRKAVFLCVNHNPLNALLLGANLLLEYRDLVGNPTIEIEIAHDLSITALRACGIKIALITDPVYISASLLTGVISIPVPEPDELPF